METEKLDYIFVGSKTEPINDSTQIEDKIIGAGIVAIVWHEEIGKADVEDTFVERDHGVIVIWSCFTLLKAFIIAASTC